MSEVSSLTSATGHGIRHDGGECPPTEDALETPRVKSTERRHRYFETKHLKQDLGRRSVRGGAVTLGGQGVQFVLRTVSTVVLARLLTPHDYGLVGMVTVVTGFVGMFKDLGLSQATVQRDEITHEQVSTLFWLNVALSIILTVLTALAAPAVVWFYGRSELTSITVALAGCFVFGGLASQHAALLRRQMRYRDLATADVLALLAGVLIALLMAYAGLGYWAIVGQTAASAVAYTAAVFWMARWVPSLPWRGAHVGDMVTFGMNLTGFRLVNYFARNADNMLIGWYWGTGPLGLYSKAYQLLMLPIQKINAPIANVALPALCRIKDDPHRFRSYYLRLANLIGYLSLPMIAFMASTSEELVAAVLGSAWLEAGRIFRWLALAALLQPLSNMSGWLYIASGRTTEMFRWGLISAPLVVVGFVCGLPWGATGVAIAYAVTVNLLVIPCQWLACRGTPVRLADCTKAVRWPLAMAATCYLGAESGQRLAADHQAIITLISASLGTAVVAGLLVLVCPTVRRELWDLASNLRHLRRKGPQADRPIYETAPPADPQRASASSAS